MKAEGARCESEQKKMQKAVVARKETGTAEHGKTSDIGYFLFTEEGDEGRALMGGGGGNMRGL